MDRAAPRFFRSSVEAAGFECLQAGVEHDDPEMAAIAARRLEFCGAEQVRFAFENIFGGIRPRRMVPDLLALAHVIANGLPMVILPLGADQSRKTTRCAEPGASRTLDQADLAPEHIHDLVTDVLDAPGYRQAAERLRDELDALPGPKRAVEWLERLASERSPMIAPR